MPKKIKINELESNTENKLAEMVILDHALANSSRDLSKLGNIEFDLFRKNIHNSGYSSKTIIGVDEVGRGCLAGPVYAAAVILPKQLHPDLKDPLFPNFLFAELNDSKQLSAKLRESIAQSIETHARWALGVASPDEVDSLNILQASLLAMKRAVSKLMEITSNSNHDTVILIDGNKQFSDIKTRQITIVKGDNRSASIAAASVIAKVERDKFMVSLSKDYPVYNWDKNKGYPSTSHRMAILSHGLSRWHRKTFRCSEPKKRD